MESPPSRSASAALAHISLSQSTTTTHDTNDADGSSDPNLGPRIGTWTGIGAVILILMSISGWFFYRRGKKKRAKLEQQNAGDQEQGHMNSATTNNSSMPAGELLTGGKPELCGESADPARVRTELPGDIERPLLSSINQGNGSAHRTGDGTNRGESGPGELSEMPPTAVGGAVGVVELDGNSSTAINLVELPGCLPPLKGTRTATGQMVIASGEAARTGTILGRNTANPLSQPCCSEHNL